MKMRGVLSSDTRGLSNMIAYIILVGMAVSMSVLAYNWLLNTVPKETIECPEGVSVSIRDVTCTGSIDPDDSGPLEPYELYFTVKNNGAFTVDKLRFFLNDEERSNVGFYEIKTEPNNEFRVIEKYPPSPNIFPFQPNGETITYVLDYRDFVTNAPGDGRGILKSDLKLLEIRPYKIIEGREYTCRTVQTKLSCPTS